MGANWNGFTKVDNARVGFGQVEPNHLAGQRTSQLYAQMPAASTIDILENGQFVIYGGGIKEGTEPNDYDVVSLPTASPVMEPMMVWNEIKLYDERKQMYKDYAMQKSDFTLGSTEIRHDGLGAFAGQMTPRVMKTFVGDIMTTNTLVAASTSDSSVTDITSALVKGAELGINANGYLDPDGDTTFMTWKVLKVSTMPDGQPAVKVQRIK